MRRMLGLSLKHHRSVRDRAQRGNKQKSVWLCLDFKLGSLEGHSMSKKSLFFALQVGIVALATAGAARAQTTSGLITGTITDQSDAVLPGTRVELKNQATGVERKAIADSAGHYTVPELQPGVYDVSVSKEGFATQS